MVLDMGLCEGIYYPEMGLHAQSSVQVYMDVIVAIPLSHTIAPLPSPTYECF